MYAVEKDFVYSMSQKDSRWEKEERTECTKIIQEGEEKKREWVVVVVVELCVKKMETRGKDNEIKEIVQKIREREEGLCTTALVCKWVSITEKESGIRWEWVRIRETMHAIYINEGMRETWREGN